MTNGLKDFMRDLLPPILGAVVAIMGAYIAVREDVTTLKVNQETMIAEDREYREEMKYLYAEQHEQDVRIAVLEEKHK